MATTTKAPPKSFRGRSARELMSAEAADGGPPVTVFGQTTRLLTLHAGPELVVEEPGADPTQLPEAQTDVITLHVAGYNKIAIQCPIIESSVPEGTCIGIEALTFLNGVWVPLTDATDGPFIPVHEPKINADGIPLPISSGWFVIDPSLNRDNLTIRWVVFGGDGTGEFVMGDIFIELTSDPRPPLTQVPDPEPPTGGELYALWLVNEGSGQFVENKAIGGVTPRRLILGNEVGPDDGDPAWFSAPRRLTMGGGVASPKDKMHYPNAPSVAAGSALFFYYELDALGTGDKIVCGLEGDVLDHQLVISSSTRLLSVSVTEDTGGGTTRTATSVTTLPNGFKGMIGFAHDGTTLGVYVNPVDGLPEATVACGAALEPGGARALILGANAILATNTVDNSSIGDIAFWIGNEIPSPATIAEWYALCKTVYPDLP